MEKTTRHVLNSIYRSAFKMYLKDTKRDAGLCIRLAIRKSPENRRFTLIAHSYLRNVETEVNSGFVGVLPKTIKKFIIFKRLIRLTK